MAINNIVQQVVPNSLESMIEIVTQPWEKAPLLSAHAKGKKIIGCFPVYTPLEIIHACNGAALPLFGGGNQVEIMNADSRFASFICSISKSTLELQLQNKFRNFDGVVLSNICDVARNLASVMKRNSKLNIEYLHLPQNDNIEIALPYYKSELSRFLRKVADITGCFPTDASLSRSTALYNKLRGLLEDLHGFVSNDGRLGAFEYTVYLRYCYSMLPEDAVTFLGSLLNSMSDRVPRNRDCIKIIIEGAFCEQPPIELIRAIEETGCWIVDDDFAKGLRWHVGPVQEKGDPIEMLARSYFESAQPSSVRHDFKTRREDLLVKKVRKYNADGVLFFIPKFCEPALFDYARYKEKLESEGIAHLQIEYEEKMWTFERIRSEVETFVESVLFW
ncbi:MAG: 2-hydroxyacyl-CoA dehydratase [Planctomycetes bacterium]|nr:2-hydroxyacyl-CoA dehydratase [Planctomycetota bacterium]